MQCGDSRLGRGKYKNSIFVDLKVYLGISRNSKNKKVLLTKLTINNEPQ